MRFQLSFSRKSVVVKNNVETCFFWKHASISGCALYTGAHCTQVNTVMLKKMNRVAGSLVQWFLSNIQDGRPFLHVFLGSLDSIPRL